MMIMRLGLGKYCGTIQWLLLLLLLMTNIPEDIPAGLMVVSGSLVDHNYNLRGSCLVFGFVRAT